jgi:Sulfotransferase family
VRGKVLPYKPRTNLQWGQFCAVSLFEGFKHRAEFADVERFCLFLGYGRSGHTLVGEMLNAHREVVVSHELDALNFVKHHFTRTQVFGLILARDRAFGSSGRQWTGYDYVVPNQFQGRFERLRVIGDKKGGGTSLRLGEDPGLLERLRREVKVPIRAVHVVRNPFDNIARLYLRLREPTLEKAIGRYEDLCRGVKMTRTSLSSDEILDIRYEDFVSGPEESLARMCKFVGVEPYPDYVADCASIVHTPTKRARDLVEWSSKEQDQVFRLIDQYDALEGYEFSS